MRATKLAQMDKWEYTATGGLRMLTVSLSATSLRCNLALLINSKDRMRFLYYIFKVGFEDLSDKQSKNLKDVDYHKTFT